MNEKDFEQLMRDAAAGAAQEEEEIAEAKGKNTTVPKELDDKIEKALKATTPRKSRRWLRRAAVIVTAFAALNLIAYVSVEAYRLNVNQVFGSMSRQEDGEEGVVWYDQEGKSNENYADDEALLQFYNDNFLFDLQAPIGMNQLNSVDISEWSYSATWGIPGETRPDAADGEYVVTATAGLYISNDAGNIETEYFNRMKKGLTPLGSQEAKIEEIEVQGQTGYYCVSKAYEGDYYIEGSYEPLHNSEGNQNMEIVWMDENRSYHFNLTMSQNDARFNALQKEWKKAVLAMHRIDRKEKTVLHDLDQPDLSFSEELRDVWVGYSEPLYSMFKNLPWDNTEYNIAFNGKLYIDAVQSLSEQELHQSHYTTYWDINLGDIKADPQKYTGEKLGLKSVKPVAEEKVEAGSDLSNEIANGRKFYIITFEDEAETEGQLYLLSDGGIEEETSFNRNYFESAYIEGYLLGFDKEGRVILGK